MADIDPNLAEASAKLTELFNQLGTSIRTGMDASESSVRVAERTQSSLETELKKFGLKINELTKDLEDDDDELKKRIKLQKEVNETIEKGLKAEADAKGVSVETLKLQKEQNTATEKQLRNLQEQRDSIVGLTREQNASIEALQKEINQRQLQADSTKSQGAKVTAALQQMTSASGVLSVAQGAATAKFGATAEGAMGVNLAFSLLNAGLSLGSLAFDQWKAGIENSFEAQREYNTALISGADGYKLANTQQLSKMRLDAKQTKEQSALYEKIGFGLGSTAIGLVALRTTSIGAAIGIGAMSLPVTLVVAGLTTLAALFGLKVAQEKFLQAQEEETAAKDLENATTLKDKLYTTYMDIGKAGLVGSQGLTALTENAHKAGFAIKDIDKFTSALKNNQKEMSMFAGGAAAGVDKFASVTGEMTASLGDHFRNLGISVEEQAEETAKYMALQSRLGLLQGKTITELATGAGKYLEELDKTATLLGTSRKEQEDSRKAVMAIEQLRAAQMVAEENGDKAESERLGRYAKMAEMLISKGLTQEGAGVAKLGASKGAVTDKDTVIARQTYSNDLFNKLDKNIGSQTDQTRQLVKETKSAALRSASSLAATGADTGMTGGKYGATADMARAAENQEAAVREAAAKKGIKEGTPEYNKFFEDFLVEQKTATEKATTDANKLRESQQKAAIAEDSRLIGFGNTFQGATTTFSGAVDKFAGGKEGAASTQTVQASNDLAALQKEIVDNTAKRDTELANQKKAITAEEKASADRGVKYWNEKLKDLEKEKPEKEKIKNKQEALDKENAKIKEAEAKQAKTMETASFAQKMGFGIDADQKKADQEVQKAQEGLIAVRNKSLNAFESAPAAAPMQRMNLSVPNAAGPAAAAPAAQKTAPAAAPAAAASAAQKTAPTAAAAPTAVAPVAAPTAAAPTAVAPVAAPTAVAPAAAAPTAVAPAAAPTAVAPAAAAPTAVAPVAAPTAVAPAAAPAAAAPVAAPTAVAPAAAPAAAAPAAAPMQRMNLSVPNAAGPAAQKTAPAAVAPVAQKTAPAAVAPAAQKTAPVAAPTAQKTAPAAVAPAAAQVAGAPKIEDLFQFGGETGQKSNFDQLDGSFKDRLVNAAKAYIEAGGKKIKLASAFRGQEDQERLYNTWIKAGGNLETKPTAAGITTPALPVSMGGQPNSHGLGNAIDAGDQASDINNKIKLKDFGLRWGGTFNKPDPVHIQLANFTPGTDKAAPTTVSKKSTLSAEPTGGLINMIKGLESFSPTAKKDHKQYSIGYGTKANSPDEGPISESEATSRLMSSLAGATKYVASFGSKFGYKWGQPQLDALSSFAYNGGNGFIDQVTLNGTRSNQQILAKIPEYNQASEKESPGLVRRRAIEAGMFGQNLSAANGGIVNGPSSGYPATLHGNEIITPLSPNSILEQLGKTPVTTEIAGSSSSSTSNTIKEIYSMNTEIMEMLAGKLDDMIDRLDRGNTYSDKLVKAMA